LNGSEAASFLIGAYNFQAVEIEVFQVIFPLLSSTEFSNLKDLLGFQDKTFQSLYRGSRDGYEARKIHGMVDGNENIVVVVKSTTGFIFGGYMSVQFRYVSGYVQDDASFLWTLTNPSNKPTKMYHTNNNLNDVYMNYGYGPTFGSGHDFHIADNSGTNGNSFIRCGTTYMCPFGSCGDPTGVFVHGGGNGHFQAQDIEIFTVSDNACAGGLCTCNSSQ
jgi:hypothetical protein